MLSSCSLYLIMLIDNLVIYNNLIYRDQIHKKLKLNNVFGIKMFTSQNEQGSLHIFAIRIVDNLCYFNTAAV